MRKRAQWRGSFLGWYYVSAYVRGFDGRVKFIVVVWDEGEWLLEKSTKSPEKCTTSH
jgi:hypothetical protein